MKKVITRVISAVALISTMALLLSGCFFRDEGNPVLGKEGAMLLLANERMRGEMFDKNDSIFRDAESALTGMAEQGREFLTAYDNKNEGESINVRLASSSNLVTDIAAPGRSYTQFNETVLQSVTLAERGAENIRMMKERVRVLDTWVVIDDMMMLLHVEENSEVLLTSNGYYDTMCYRTRLEDGTERYDLIQLVKSEGFITRASYIKNKLYDCNMIMDVNGDEYEYIGFVAQLVGGIWECLEYRHIPINEIPYDYNYVIMTDDLCFKASKNMYNDGNISRIVLSSEDRTVDIATIEEYDDLTCYNIFVGAYEGYRGVLVGGKDEYDNNLVLGDGTVLENGQETPEGEIGARYLVKYDTAWGTEFEMSFDIRGGEHSERNVKFAEYLRKIGISYKGDTTEELLAKINRAREIIEDIDRDFEWNGHPIGTHEGSRAAHAEEHKIIDGYIGIIESYKDNPRVNYEDIEGLDLASFAGLEGASYDLDVKENSVTVISASATVNDLSLFTVGENYHLAFALMNDSGIIHIEGYEKQEITLDGESITLSANNIKLDLEEIAAGEYKIVMYASTSDGIRSTEATVIGKITIIEEI